MGQYVDFYCSDNNRELKKIVTPILSYKFGWLAQKDYDDFYSIASMVVWDCEQKFDGKKVKTKKFKSFLSACIHNKIKQQLTYMHRDKRVLKDNEGNPIYDTSIDIQIGEDESTTLGEMLCSDFDIEIALSKTTECGYSKKIEIFLNNLSETPRKIAKMIMGGDSGKEIKEKLKLTDKEYQDYWKIINSYEKKRVLYEENNNVEDDEMNTTILTEDVAESYKNTSYSIDSISKQLQKKRIRDDHILQRHSGQWKGFAKSELISDILRGKSLTQIIISEEIKNGLRMQWLIDGKQRCTTLDDFLHDGFAISKNVKNYNIRYQTTKLDESGYEVLNEDGFTVMEFKEFNIRGKKFSQLPEELQEIFKDRQIPVLYNMNCTKKDIADDIARFNRSRPMNVAQNGWLGLEETFAELVENISKMQFFQQDFKGTAYTNTNHTSGAIRRMIVEAIVASDFIEEFDDFGKMCEFLSEEASDSNFTEFYSFVERLTSVCDERTAKMFNTTDGFLWLGLFSRFANLGVNDDKFVDFMLEFENSMRDIKVNVSYDGEDDNSFNNLCINPKTKKSRATKDKNMVIAKMQLLEKLMLRYLHINKEDVEEVDYKELVKANVENIIDDDIEEIQMVANDISEEFDEDSWMISEQNYPAYLSIVGLAFRKDVEDKLREWLPIYIKTNQFIHNQQKAFLHMKKSFEKYLEKEMVA